MENAKNLPVVVNPHGGPWARDSWGYNPEVQFLANRGYAVLQTVSYSHLMCIRDRSRPEEGILSFHEARVDISPVQAQGHGQ